MALLLFYIFLALSVSFLCSIMEAVLLSVTPSFMAQMETERPVTGRLLRKFKAEVDHPLAAILSLNTIAHTVGAAGAGAQATHVFGDAFVGVISGVLTFLILVFSEIIPKTLGAVYWRTLTPPVVRLLVPTIWLMYPLVKMSKGLTRLLARDRDRSLLSREEFKSLAAIGAQEGVLHEDESRILQNMFRFRNVAVRDIMTPRTVIFALPCSMSVSEVISRHDELKVSRIPVYRDSLDTIAGFVLKSDILSRAARGAGDTLLSDLKKPILIIPADLSIRRLFHRLMTEHAHIALAVDEYGGTEGIVTLEDFLETLLGLEIIDEMDEVRDLQAFARKQWLVRAERLGIISSSTPEDSPDHGGNPPAPA